MTNIGKLERRYMNDPAFHQLVKALENLIETLTMSPSEIREAAMFAVYLNELRHPKLVSIMKGQHDI